MAITNWQILHREQVFKKYSRTIDRIDYKLPNGAEADFYIKAEGPSVATLALTEHDEVILARQFRPGPNAILNELPGGFIDPGEDALTAAKREFLEETGYTGDFVFIGTCLDDAYSTMQRHCFVATNCKKVSEIQSTTTEHTELILMPFAEFRQHIKTGQMTDIEVAYLALDHLNRL